MWTTDVSLLYTVGLPYLWIPPLGGTRGDCKKLEHCGFCAEEEDCMVIYIKSLLGSLHPATL